MRFVKILAIFALLMAALLSIGSADKPGIAASKGISTPVPRYNHIIVLMEENHSFSQIIGNPAAPVINHLAQVYGLATHYTAVGDPSEPNYVGLIGGNTYGIADDNAYYTHTINKASLVDQLEGANLTWKGYFQSMPYAGFTGTCFPIKCEGTPDIGALYGSKHNGFLEFAHVQNSQQELQKLVPDTQFEQDVQKNQLPNFSFVAPDLCHDMHGAPPWCVDGGATGSATDNWLLSEGDTYAQQLVNEVTGSAMWANGNNAMVITWDEGNSMNSRVSTIVITSHGPRTLQDSTPYNHYSLLRTVELAFGLGCIELTCDSDTVRPMVLLFAV